MIKSGFPKKWVGNSPMFFFDFQNTRMTMRTWQEMWPCAPGRFWRCNFNTCATPQETATDWQYHPPGCRECVAHRPQPKPYKLGKVRGAEKKNPKKSNFPRDVFFKWDWRCWIFVHIRLIDLVDVWVLYYFFVLLYGFYIFIFMMFYVITFNQS